MSSGPKLHESSPEDYFGRVANDEGLPASLRLKAAGEVAALRMPATIGQYQYAIRLAIAYEDAITAYKRSFARQDRSSDPSETAG